MQALSVEKLPEGAWLYGLKLDGYRALAFKDGKDVRLISRNNKPFNYPQLLDALKSLPADRVILDGEIRYLREAENTFAAWMVLNRILFDPNADHNHPEGLL
jgi:ATP-dependent DNA ligase